MATPKILTQVEAIVSVDGTALQKGFVIGSVRIHHAFNRIPRAVIHIPDGDPAGQNFPLSEGKKPELKPGKKVKITFKDSNGPTKYDLFEGILVKHGIRIKNGKNQIVLEARDKAVKMTLGVQNRFFSKKKDSEIIQDLIQKSGAQADVAATKYKHPVLFQTAMTDWDFMLMRAEALGLLILCKANKISVKKPDFKSKELSLQYGTNVIEADLEYDARTQAQSCTASSWDISKGEVVTSNKKAPGTKIPDSPGKWKAQDFAKDFAPATEHLLHRGVLDKANLDAFAEARMLKSRMARLKGWVSSHGFDVSPGSTLKLDGMGAHFSGELQVTGVEQRLDGGVWTTRVQTGISQEWHQQQYQLGTPAKQGYANRLHGLQPAKVTKLEEDPESHIRIEVNLNFWGKEPPCKVWARMASPDAGKKRGFFWPPSVGDEVVVGFMDGDPAYPVVLGSMYSSKSAPPLALSKENAKKGIFTSSEMKWIFDDEKKTIHIETPGGHKIDIDDENKCIKFQDSNKNQLTLDDKGITLKSAKDIKLDAGSGKIDLTGGSGGINLKSSSGDVKLEGMNVKCDAKTKFSAEGKGGTDIKSSGILTVKGSMVKIN